MRYNENITFEYGESNIPSLASPVAYKPLPTEEDYKLGYIIRTFAKKINENTIVEMNYADAKEINSDLYAVITATWKITGPRNNLRKGSMIMDDGVEDQNKFEIDRIIKEQGIDLSKALPDPLEYWRGY